MSFARTRALITRLQITTSAIHLRRPSISYRSLLFYVLALYPTHSFSFSRLAPLPYIENRDRPKPRERVRGFTCGIMSSVEVKKFVSTTQIFLASDPTADSAHAKLEGTNDGADQIKKSTTKKTKVTAKVTRRSARIKNKNLDMLQTDQHDIIATVSEDSLEIEASVEISASPSEDIGVTVTPEFNELKRKSETKSPRSSPKNSIPKKKKRSTSPEPGSRKPPAGWLEIYSLVEELRQDRSAPVDTNGSEALPDKEASPETFRFQVLVALLLSSQTKDNVVGDAIRTLQKHGLTVDNIAKTEESRIDEMIRKVGFHNRKSDYLKRIVVILQEKYDGDIPPTAEEMMELPGIGPKMAYIIESVAWNKVSGIGIDTHMHRMFNQLGWVSSKNPEQTRIQLESWLPRDRWDTVNILWVGFGQEVQQFKPKLLRKSLECSRPFEALKLVKKLGLDYKKEGEKIGQSETIKVILSRK